MAIFSKNLGGHGPFGPPGYAYDGQPPKETPKNIRDQPIEG